MLNIRNFALYPLGAPSEKPLLRLESLELMAAEVVTLMGPSGVGKSTLLRWVLGEPLPAFRIQGELMLNGSDLLQLPIAQRQVGMMFQKGGLFPHMTVKENCLFAQQPRSVLKQKTSHVSLETKALSLLDELGLKKKWPVYPYSLSGGQYSRIALLCALLAEPKVMLLDEPFSSLDATLREDVRRWTFQQLKARDIPTLLVTHDRADAEGHILTVSNHNETIDD